MIPCDLAGVRRMGRDGWQGGERLYEILFYFWDPLGSVLCWAIGTFSKAFWYREGDWP